MKDLKLDPCTKCGTRPQIEQWPSGAYVAVHHCTFGVQIKITCDSIIGLSCNWLLWNDTERKQ